MMVDVHRALDPTVRERLCHSAGDQTAVFGTPGFMAPEQEREGIVTVRTDIYGLGATLRAAAGQLPIADGFRPHSSIDDWPGHEPAAAHGRGRSPAVRMLAGQGRPADNEARLGTAADGKSPAEVFFRWTASRCSHQAGGSRALDLGRCLGTSEVSAISRPIRNCRPIFQFACRDAVPHPDGVHSHLYACHRRERDPQRPGPLTS